MLSKERIKHEFATEKEKVEYILQNYEASQVSDKILFNLYMKEYTPFRIINLDRVINLLQEKPELILPKKLLDFFNTDKLISKLISFLRKNAGRIFDIDSFPNWHTVSRCRRVIQNDEDRLNVKQIKEKRKEKERIIREYMINQKRETGDVI